MDEQPNLHEFINEVSNFTDETIAKPAKAKSAAPVAIGQVVEIAGSGSQIRMDSAALTALQSHADSSMAMSGQVGSQVKMLVGASFLIANVRTLRSADSGELFAHVDFLGEGVQDSGGKLSNFRRGVTPYPVPGCAVLPVTTADMRSVFA